MTKAMFKSHLIGIILILSTSCLKSNSEPTADTDSVMIVDSTIYRSQVSARTLLYRKDPTISYCESTNGQSETYSGYRDLKPYPLASLSKIFLTAWAVDQLGPDYRFQMVWKFKKVTSDGTVDAYLQTNYDPVVNIEKILYALSELNKKGVFKIRNLLIDETTRFYLSVLSNPHLELTDVPVTTKQTIENLNRILNSSNWGMQTENAKNNLLNINIPSTFSVNQISYLPRSSINVAQYNEELQISSAPLFKYLKYLNVSSNNYVSDSLFQFLGGAEGFGRFQNSVLNIPKIELQIGTGSGLPIQSTQSILQNGQALHNKGNCLSILRTLKFIDGSARKYNLNLGHLLLTAGRDQGTYESQLTFNSNIVLKTGRLFDLPTLNVAGISASSSGYTYFAMLAHDFDNLDEAAVKIKRDELISDLIKSNSQQKAYLTLKLDTLFF